MLPHNSTNLLSTREAAKLLGYTHDYIARMCRSGKIPATRIGTSWYLTRKDAELFARTHNKKLAAYRKTLADAMREERLEKTYAMPARVRALPRARLYPVVALAALFVLSSPVAASVILGGEGDALLRSAQAPFDLSIASARAKAIEAHGGYDTSSLALPHPPSVEDVARTAEPFTKLAHDATVTKVLPSTVVADRLARIPAVPDTSAHQIASALFRAYVSIGTRALTLIEGTRDAYVAFLNGAGNAVASDSVVGAAMWYAEATNVLAEYGARGEIAFGTLLINTSNRIIELDQQFAYGFAETSKQIPPRVALSLYRLGSQLEEAAVFAPARIARAYDSAIYAWVDGSLDLVARVNRAPTVAYAALPHPDLPQLTFGVPAPPHIALPELSLPSMVLSHTDPPRAHRGSILAASVAAPHIPLPDVSSYGAAAAYTVHGAALDFLSNVGETILSFFKRPESGGAELVIPTSAATTTAGTSVTNVSVTAYGATKQYVDDAIASLTSVVNRRLNALPAPIVNNYYNSYFGGSRHVTHVENSSGGGGGTPGGADTEVQYNNAGAFGGSSTFTFNAAEDRLTLSFASTTGISTSYASTTNLFANLLTLAANLNGPLQANSGVVSATSSIGVTYGGTGMTTRPSYGQLLIGDGTGGYSFVATSSLGINAGAASAGGANTQVQFNDAGTLNGNSQFTFDQIAHRLTLAFASTTGFSSSYSSSTSFFAGNSTTTGNAYVGGRLGIGAYSSIDSANATFSFYDSGANPRITYNLGTFTTYNGGGNQTFSVDGNGKGTLSYASTTGFSSSYASSTSAFFGALSVGNLSGLIKAAGGIISTASAGTDYENPLTFAYPLVRSVNAISLAFGTTTQNSWSAHNIFSSFFATNASTTNATTTNLHITGILSSLLKTDSSGRVTSATAGTDYIAGGAGAATTTLVAGTNVSFSGGTPVIFGASPVTINASGGGLSSYDAWTHPSAGQSATTSLMLFNGNASTTGISASYASSTSAFFGTASVGANLGVTGTANVGALSIGSLSGIIKTISGAVVTATPGTDYIAGGAGAATTTLSFSGPFSTSATPVVFGASPITTTYYGLATTSNISQGQVLYGTSASGVASVATSTPSLSGTFSYSGTLGSFVGGASGTLSLATNGVALTNLAQIAANTVLVNNTGASGNVTAIATSTFFGTGTGGQVLTWANGQPQWVASTTYANGTGISTSFAAGQLTITNTGLITYDAWTHPLSGWSATTTTLRTGGFYATASSTIGDGTAAGGLTISGNATTTGQGVLKDGTIAGPSTGFASEPGNGIYRATAGVFGVAINGGGRLGVTASNQVFVQSSGVYGFNSGTGITSADTAISRIAAGVIGVGTGATGSVGGTLIAGTVGLGTTSPYAALSVAVSSGVGLAIDALSGYSGNLIDLKVASTTKFNITESGALIAGSSITSGGSVTASTNGAFLISGKSRLKSTVDGNIELYNAALSDFGRLNLGGTTSSFSAIKRNGAGIDIRLADDSGYASTTASIFNATSNTASWLPYASSTAFSSTYASSTNGLFGTLTVGTLSGLLKATNGLVSTATAGTDYVAGGAGAATTTVSCSGSISCSGFTVFGSSPVTISGSGGGLSSYDAWTHPAAGQSATTSLMLFNGAASSTQLSATVAYFGGSATSTFTSAGFLGIGSSSPWGQLSVNPNALGSGVPEFVIGSSSATHFIVDGAGRVGVGTSPAAGFSINTANGIQSASIIAASSFQTATGPGFTFGADTDTGIFGSNNGNIVGVSTGGSEIARFTTSGLGVGTSTPFARFAIAGTAGGTSALFAISSSTAGFATTTVALIDANGNAAFGFNGAHVNIGTTTTGLNAGLSIDYNSSVAGAGLKVFSSTNQSILSAGRLTLNAAYAGTGGGYIENVSGNLNLAASSGSGAITFLRNAGSIENARFDGSGNLGIGSTSPYARLGVSGFSSGAGIVADALSGFTGNLFDLKVASSTKFSVNEAGTITTALGSGLVKSTIGVLGLATAGTDYVAGGAGAATTTVSCSGGTSCTGFVAFASSPITISSTAGLSSYDAWTHPATGQSATTSLMLFNGAASSTQLSATQAFFGGSATSTFTSAGFLGVGSSSPWAQLSVNPMSANGTAPAFVIGSSSATTFIVTNGGNIGIGTASPISPLDVLQTNGTYGLTIRDTSTGVGTVRGIGFYRATNTAAAAIVPTVASGGSTGLIFQYTPSSGSLQEGMRISNLGNIGIGTTTPQWALTVSSSTAPQLTLTDASATSVPFNLRSINGTLYLSTSSPTTFATTTTSALAVNGTTGALTLGSGITTGAPSPLLKFGSYYDNAGDVSVSHIDLYGGTYGLGVSTGQLNFIAGSAGGHAFFTNANLTTPAAVITSAGNVGIGSSSPWAQLSVNPTSANGTAPAFVIGSSSATSFIVTNAGRVGIGTTSPAVSLVNNGDFITKGPWVDVRAYGAVGDGSHDDTAAIQYAINSIAATGGTVFLPIGTFRITSTITIATSSIRFVGAGSYGTADAGVSSKGTTLVWAGSANGTMLSVSAVSGASNNALKRVTVADLSLNCAESAGYGLSIRSSQFGEFRNLFLTACINTAVDMNVVATLGEARDNSKNEFANISIRQIDGVAASATSTSLDGDSGANTSNNNFTNISIVHKNGKALYLGSADNNRFYGITINRAAGGSALGVELMGNNDEALSARNNYFYYLSAGAGGITARATGYASPAADNWVFGYETSNGEGAPTIETGAKLYYSTDNAFIGIPYAGLAVGDTETNALTARASLGTESLRLYNVSDNHLILDASTGNDWGINVDTSTGALRFSEIGAGHRIYFAAGGKLGIGSSSPWAQLAVNTIAGSPAFAVGSSTGTQFIIDSTGRVGIGTSTPSALLDVSASSATAYSGSALLSVSRARIINLDTTNNNGSALNFTTADANGTLSSGAAITGVFTSHSATAVSADLAFQTRNAGTIGETMRLTSYGAVGIGTTTPQWRLTVASSTGPQVTLTDGSATAAPWNLRANGNYFTLSTSSVSTFATTTLSVLQLDSSTGSTSIQKLSITGSATSTAANGINITSGCFAINGVCVGGSSSGLASYDAWTHPSAGQSATTSLMLFNGAASTTSFTSTGLTYLGTGAGVAVGTTTISARQLTVGSNSDANLSLYANSTGKNWSFDTIASSGRLRIASGVGGEVVTFLEGGNVGIGTSSPLALLSIYGGSSAGAINAGVWDSLRNGITLNGQLASSATGYNILSGAGDTNLYLNRPSGSAIKFREANGSTDQFTILTGGGGIFPDGNLSVCTGGACPSGSPAGNGNVIAETAIGIGSSTPWAGLSIVSGKAIVAAENTLATSTSMTVDWRNGNQQLVRIGTSGTTISFTGFIEGQKLVLTVCNPNASAGAISWGTQILWSGGTAPTQTTTANKCDVWSFLATSATSTLKIFGAQSANF